MIKVSFIALSGLFVAFTQAAAFAQCLPQDGAVVEGTLVQGPKGSFLVELSDEGACKNRQARNLRELIRERFIS